ncbi:hypothetical protein B0H19DRAFT_1141548 [Mycena capillaripes]|nr:hypothetical protein B0H19DRAFT_1141548 [Mycena capillaripes]
MADTPVFPPELELEIFTTAAIIHEETIPTLLRVAHRVLVWIEPLLYRTLTFTTARDAARFSAAVQTIKAKSPAFIHENVRHLMCSDHFPDQEMDTLLSLCTGVQHLVLWSRTSRAFQVLRSLRLTRLTLPLLDAQMIKSSLVALTHLNGRASAWDFDYRWINTLPSLTHLCVENPIPGYRVLIHNLLEGNEKLQVVICTVSSMTVYRTRHGPWIDDERVVMMRLKEHHRQVVLDWKVGIAGGRDSWVRAEEFLARKRNDKSITTQLYEDEA